MKLLIKQRLREALLENKYQDQALDKLSKVGGFDKLPDLERLVLLAPSGDISKLKNINLQKVYKEKGGTFGNLQIKVRVKDINNQPIDHKFSKEFAGKDGYLFSPIHYDDKSQPYVIVRFKEFTSNPEYKGGGSYEERPIMLANIFPIDYNDIDDEFAKYQNKIDFDRKEFMSDFD